MAEELIPWTVFTAEAINGILVLKEYTVVDAYGEDDAIISAVEKKGSKHEMRYVAMPEDEAAGREVVLSYHARFA